MTGEVPPPRLDLYQPGERVTSYFEEEPIMVVRMPGTVASAHAVEHDGEIETLYHHFKGTVRACHEHDRVVIGTFEDVDHPREADDLRAFPESHLSRLPASDGGVDGED